MKLGDVIRVLREKRSLSQAGLAEKAECSQQTIGKIEKNKVRKPANLPNIAKALGTNAEAILAQVNEDISEPARQRTRAIPQRKNRARWPFEIKYELFDDLTTPQQLEIEALIFSKINEFRAQSASMTRKSKRVSLPKATKRMGSREPDELYQRTGGSVALPKGT